jgi:hypothetical protein
MTRNNKMWHSSCKHCAITLTNIGSSRPKTVCRPCRLQQMKQVSAARYVKKNKTANLPLLKVKQRNEQVIVDEKLRRGKCLACNLSVEKHNASEFDFDHRDREHKTGNVSKLKYCNVDRLINEMTKCDLLCCRCHRRKTLNNKDFAKPTTRVLQTTLF